MTKLPSAGYKAQDRGPLEFESKLREEKGDIITLAREEVITISPSRSIKDASELMVSEGVRRLPIINPGTKKLQGVLVSRDIIDFLGGGEKNNIIKNKHDGNFLSAINDSVRLIMNPDHAYGTIDLSIAKTAEILIEEGVGGVPILNKEMQIKGIITERDFAKYIPSKTQTRVEGHMTKKVTTVTPETTIKDGMKKMISQGFRRLPVVEDGELIGIVTSVDVIRYFGSNEVFNHMASGNPEEAMQVEVKEIMSSNVLTVTPEIDLGEAAKLMAENDYGGLPVLKDNEILGIITERDLLEILA
ncbi:MAG: CBS domain-containing protein [Hadesarchaea archaeon]|nr:CBS domain-containing protein [Hadesarchaea archaeon]